MENDDLLFKNINQFLCPKCHNIPLIYPYYKNSQLMIETKCSKNHFFTYTYENFIAESKKSVNKFKSKYEKCIFDDNEIIGYCEDCEIKFCIYCKNIHENHNKKIKYEMVFSNDKKIEFNSKIFKYKKDVEIIKILIEKNYTKINEFLKNINNHINLIEYYYNLYEKFIKEKNINMNFLLNFEKIFSFSQNEYNEIIENLKSNLSINFYSMNELFNNEVNLKSYFSKKNYENFIINNFNITTSISLECDNIFILNDNRILTYDDNLIYIYEKDTYNNKIKIEYNKYHKSNETFEIKKIFQLNDNRILIFCEESHLLILKLLKNNKYYILSNFNSHYFKKIKNVLQLNNNKIILTSNSFMKLFNNDKNISFIENIEFEYYNDIKIDKKENNIDNNNLNNEENENNLNDDSDDDSDNNSESESDSIISESNKNGNNNALYFKIHFIIEMKENNIFMLENHKYFSYLKGFNINKKVDKIMFVQKKYYNIRKKNIVKLNNEYICYVYNKNFYILSFYNNGMVKYIINENHLKKNINCLLLLKNNILLVAIEKTIFQYYFNEENKINFIGKKNFNTEFSMIYKLNNMIALFNKDDNNIYILS